MSAKRWGKATAATTLVAVVLLGTTGTAMGAGDANMASCPQSTEESPGFRTYLPDCRAYELVSPAYTGGFPIGGEFFNTKGLAPVAASGQSVVGVSLGVFGGAEYSYLEGNTLGIPYAFSRDTGGWETQPLVPKLSQLPSPAALDFSASLETSLWQSGDNPAFTEPTAPSRLYLRDLRGQITDVGPMSPAVPEGEDNQPIYVGSSADLSRIGLEYQRGEGATTVQNPLWPGDQTVSPTNGAGQTRSLYEYARPGAAEPSLVGVRNSESVEAAAEKLGKARINEAADQISTCGIELGSGAGKNRYNAIAPSGFGIFFTAVAAPCTESGTGPSINELYVRVGGTHTLALSEPPLSLPGRACAGPCAEAQNEENGFSRSPAVFAGASESGTRVYFTTTQPMVNADRDQAADLYMEELSESEVTRIVDVSQGDGTDPSPGEGASVLGVPRVSEDGSRVYFVAEGILTTVANANGESATAGGKNLYVYDVEDGATNFVAGVASADEPLLWGAENARYAQTSAPDGRFFIFVTGAHPRGTGDTSGNGEEVGQLFEYDAVERTLTRVSIGQQGQYLCATTGVVEEGYNCNGNVQQASHAPTISLQAFYASRDLAFGPHTQINVTADGTVFFLSSAALTPGARNGYPNFEPGLQNIYEYRNGRVFLISDGVEPPSSAPGSRVQSKTSYLSATADGGVLFLTAESLVPQDANSQVSMYDAHVDGGFPETVARSGCSGQSCRGAESQDAVLPGVGSTASQTLGNAQKKQHKKKQHKKKQHKKKQHKKKQHKKKGSGRRASDRPMGTYGGAAR
jgi:hypothetical protein